MTRLQSQSAPLEPNRAAAEPTAPAGAWADPLALRVWFPRVASDAAFDQLREHLRQAGLRRVFLFDNSYADPFQLPDSLLLPRVEILRQRITQLADDGVAAGINSGATVGHGGLAGLAEHWPDRLELPWWTDDDGAAAPGIACPISPAFLSFIDHYFTCLARTGAREIFIDDDIRPFNHSPIRSELGCLCPLHVRGFARQFGHALDRDSLVRQLRRPIVTEATALQRDWWRFVGDTFLALFARIRQAVDAVDPGIRLGVMPVQNFLLPFGADYFNRLIDVASGPHRPMLRTHNLHGLPREWHPGSAVYVRQAVSPRTEHLVELENLGHNFQDANRSPRQLRYALLGSLAAGLGSVSVNALGDQPGPWKWERRVLDMLAECGPRARAMAQWITPATTALGVPVRHPHYRRRVEALDHSDGSAWQRMVDPALCPERLLSSLGLPYVFDDVEPALLMGDLPRLLGRQGSARVLQRGCVIDSEALEQLHQLGLGDVVGVRSIGEIRSYAAVRFSSDPIHGAFAGSLLPIRRMHRIHRLEHDPAEYDVLTTVVGAGTFQEMGPGVLRRRRGPRLVILPHTLRAPLNAPGGSDAGLLVNRPHRHLLARLLAWCRPQCLPAWFDGPLFVAPCCYRGREGELVVALLNPEPDVLDDGELVLAEGAVPPAAVVHVLHADGQWRPCPTWKPRPQGREWRLHLDGDHAVPACDVMTLVLR